MTPLRWIGATVLALSLPVLVACAGEEGGNSDPTEAPAIACDVLEPGSRVAVAGVQSEGRVRVVQLEVLATP